MNRAEFINRVKKEISETKKRLKKAKEKEKYYESIKDFGEDYIAAKYNRIKEEQALLFIEPFVDLPEILYTITASSDIIGTYKKGEADKIAKKVQKIEKSIELDEMKLEELSREERDLISQHATIPSINPETEDKKVLYELMKKGAVCRDAKKQVRYVKSKKVKEMDMWIVKGIETANMSNEDYRKVLLNNIEDADEIIKMADDAKKNKDGCKVFASVINNPKAVKDLVLLLFKLKNTDTSRPDPVYLSKDIIPKLNIPEDLKEQVFENSNIYCQVFEEICDPDIGIDTIKKYIETVEEEISSLICIHSVLDDIGTGLVALDKYEKACAAAGKKLVYGDPENTSEQNDLFEFFTINQTERIIINSEGVLVADAHRIDTLFNGHVAPIILRRKKEIEFKRHVAEEQINLFRKMRDNLEVKLNGLTTLNVDKSILTENANKEKSIDDIDRDYYELKTLLNKFLILFEGYKKQREENIQKHNDSVQDVINEILDYTGCKEYDINKLLISDGGEDLITRIFENAAIYNAAKLVEDLEMEAAKISLVEQASLHGITMEELAIRLLAEQEELHEKELAEDHRKTISDVIDRVRRLTKKPKRPKDYVEEYDYDYDEEDPIEEM